MMDALPDVVSSVTPDDGDSNNALSADIDPEVNVDSNGGPAESSGSTEAAPAAATSTDFPSDPPGWDVLRRVSTEVRPGRVWTQLSCCQGCATMGTTNRSVAQLAVQGKGSFVSHLTVVEGGCVRGWLGCVCLLPH
jgi:hypothetical protein